MGASCVCINFARKGDLVLQVMAYFAQTERESIRQRQAEGIAAAKARGKKLGRQPLPEPDGFEEICVRYRSREMTMREAAEVLQMSKATFYRHFQEWDKKKLSPKGRLYKPLLL